MSVGIMQPYFFPYLGYFSIINYVDKFIFFDTPQYITHGWINRNRILKGDGTSTYITIPIKKAPQDTAIKDVRICDDIDWRVKIYGQLSVYKKKAPFYKKTMEFIESVLEKDYDTISELNIHSTIEICKHLGIECSFDIFSKMNLDIDDVKAPDEWALNITKALNEDEYVNPPGGISFFNPQKYEDANIKLRFLSSNLPRYIQRTGRFESGLSIIDIMMFCDENQIAEMLLDYEMIEK